MKIVFGLIILIASFFVSAADYSGSVTDEQLLSLCAGDKADPGKCAAFIAGIRSGMAAQRMFIGWTLAKQKDADQAKLLLWLTTREPICSKTELTDQQVTEAFITHMKHVKENNPQLLGAGAGVGVLLGAQQRFPCK